MEVSKLLEHYKSDDRIKQIQNALKNRTNLYLTGIGGSSSAVLIASLLNDGPHLVVMPEKESAAFFYHDLVQLLNESSVFFLPSSYKRSPEYGQGETPNIILRTEALNRILLKSTNYIVVTHPEAVMEKVPSSGDIVASTLALKQGESLGQPFIIEMLIAYHFQRVDFVFEPGQYSVRGSIIDIYSFSYEDPVRIDFFGDDIDSIRTFDTETQLSKQKLTEFAIIPDLSKQQNTQNLLPIGELMPESTKVWIESPDFCIERIDRIFSRIEEFNPDINISDENINPVSAHSFISGTEFSKQLFNHPLCYWGLKNMMDTKALNCEMDSQPVFHKNFNLVEENLVSFKEKGFQSYVLSDNSTQLKRLREVFNDRGAKIHYHEIEHALHEGFIDNKQKITVYTDHQIFERYHKFSLRTDQVKAARQSFSIRELNRLNPGDYIVHVDHGIGRFGGLVTTELNGKSQESIRLVFRDNDILLVNIHSLHRISKFKGKDGEPPKINKLGTAAWNNLKEKTKSKVKDIARELISLYARRKAEPGFAFSPDTYLQTELEASFFYEDTPDQEKATKAVKNDMETSTPMDRLVCGDVGFGKTEIAIRAAFKAVTDNKQVAVLVPTTILALQHYKTFTERLADFPCNISYVSRLRKPKEITESLKQLKEGQLDIIIGTHRLIGKDVQFKNLGLLIIDEEQRFGVAVKDKLKELRVNVDTLTLTATPIPRTLQFSLMGARDLSIINTPPPNRQSILTELHSFNEQIITEAINYEINRNGQVFFIHNRVQNIGEVELLLKKLLPNAKTVVAHGQMDGPKLEQIMLDFINGEYDVLIATTIIESGLDIPNANTIIINNAHAFGLSELHQLRGRVGRSNKKAFCYLMAPPTSTLTQDARRRLKIIEEYSDLGSGFNIAMQDLDIRGAGNMLGGEQSGYIADIGYETYQRILNEAMLELRDTEFKDVFPDNPVNDGKERLYLTDCQIETDIEVRLSENYIENVAERMQLYRELDNIEEEAELVTFEQNLKDRFGDLPNETSELLEIVRIRRLAKKLGIEKLIIKNGITVAYFVSDHESAFYQSAIFGSILSWLQAHPKKAAMKQTRDKLSISFPNVTTVGKCKELMIELSNEQLMK